MLRSSVPQIPVLGALLASMNGNNQTTSPISPTVNNQGNNSISPNSRNRQGSVLAKKPSFGRKQSQHGSRSENSRSTSGKSKTQQQIKNFCEFIQFFCGLSTGRMSLHEVETVILEPIVVDEAHRMGNKLMEEFDKLLKIAQIDPQDWFEYVTRKKTQMQVRALLLLFLILTTFLFYFFTLFLFNRNLSVIPNSPPKYSNYVSTYNIHLLVMMMYSNSSIISLAIVMTTVSKYSISLWHFVSTDSLLVR